MIIIRGRRWAGSFDVAQRESAGLVGWEKRYQLYGLRRKREPSSMESAGIYLAIVAARRALIFPKYTIT